MKKGGIAASEPTQQSAYDGLRSELTGSMDSVRVVDWTSCTGMLSIRGVVIEDVPAIIHNVDLSLRSHTSYQDFGTTTGATGMPIDLICGR